MSIVILDAMEGSNSISDKLKERMLQKSKELSHFELRDMKILPCRSCGVCGFKSPGKCVFKDDMHEILYAMAKSSTIVLLAPVRFGGYPSSLKKAVDKFALMALPSYTVKHGHMVHPARYGSKMLIGIGVQGQASKEREESFKRLVENNALNGQFEHKSVVLNASDDMNEIEQVIDNLLKGVC
ncbi:MAG TPA: NAD(P)H-dependent oxidoreductase [Clostridia bacterium]|nr:NAD(P)H-dependent oxidoreductase [Clostridia bacterium]